jgi:hypothetical protein
VHGPASVQPTRGAPRIDGLGHRCCLLPTDQRLRALEPLTPGKADTYEEWGDQDQSRRIGDARMAPQVASSSNFSHMGSSDAHYHTVVWHISHSRRVYLILGCVMLYIEGR